MLDCPAHQVVTSSTCATRKPWFIVTVLAGGLKVSSQARRNSAEFGYLREFTNGSRRPSPVPFSGTFFMLERPAHPIGTSSNCATTEAVVSPTPPRTQATSWRRPPNGGPWKRSERKCCGARPSSVTYCSETCSE